MQPINPLMYITDWTPVPEPIMNASQWFETERMTIHVPPGSDLNMGWFQAQGWTVVSSATSGSRVTVESDDYTRREYGYRYDLERRKLQSERVLQSMINEFTKAYNEGRLLNDRRYDEIVTLYTVMLSRSETEINVDVSSYDKLIQDVIDGLPSEFTSYEGRMEGILDGMGDSQRARINLSFDNQVAQAKQTLVTRGMSNSTVLDGVLGGIERNRQQALSDLEDKLKERELNTVDQIQQVRSQMNDRVMSAAERLREMKLKKAFDATQFRNTILTALLGFMQAREDSYPGMAELANIAAGLGYGEGSSVRAS